MMYAAFIELVILVSPTVGSRGPEAGLKLTTIKGRRVAARCPIAMLMDHVDYSENGYRIRRMQHAGRGRKSASNTLVFTQTLQCIYVFDSVYMCLTRSPAAATVEPIPSLSDRHMKLSGTERAG